MEMLTNKELLYSNLSTMNVEDFDRYLQEERNGFIKINVHPEDENILILNYTDATVYANHWTHETMTARGLILDVTSAIDYDKIYILASPFEKFFNLGENPDFEEGFEEWEIESVMEKMDGSLGISYFFNDEIRFATRGSFTSEQAIKATQIWKEKYSELHKMRMDIDLKVPITYLVEIIYPENRIVVDYLNNEELVMIGTKFIGHQVSFGADGNHHSVYTEASLLKMRSAEVYEYTIEQMLEMKKSISAQTEGWVVKFTNGKRLKIKGLEYLEVHRVIYGMSTKAKYKAWSEGSLNEYIMKIPEEYRNELEDFQEYIEVNKEALIMLYTMYYKNSVKNSNNDKEFAQYVEMNFDKSIHLYIFKAKNNNGEIPEDLVKYKMYKNYIENEKGFKEWSQKKQLL